MAIVFIPTQLRKLTNGTEQLELDVKNVRQVIEELEARFGHFEKVFANILRCVTFYREEVSRPRYMC